MDDSTFAKDPIQSLSDEDVVAILDELPRRPMLAGKDGLRLSLAGAQDKLPMVFDGARIGLPLNGTPSSHILKPAVQAVEDSVINEGFCMALAETMQLKPAKSKVHRVLGRSFLLVERYDRLIDRDEKRQQVQVQRSPGASLGAVRRRCRLYQGAGQTAHSGIGKVTARHGTQAPV